MTAFALAGAAGADAVAFAAVLALGPALGVDRGVTTPVGRVVATGPAIVGAAEADGAALAVSGGAALAVVVALGSAV